METVAGAQAAQAGGADRIELCAGLALGGLTPGAGLVRAVKRSVSLPIVLLARPRRGDFVYDDGDFQALKADVEFARGEGLAGVALGVLLDTGEVDAARTQELVEAAGEHMEVCFHRAFDETPDQEAALELLAGLGVTRVLTSGGAPDVMSGLDRLVRLQQQAGDSVCVMPGGGVTAGNIRRLLDETRARQVHLSAGKTVASAAQMPVPMQAAVIPGETQLRVTDEEVVRAVRNAL